MDLIAELSKFPNLKTLGLEFQVHSGSWNGERWHSHFNGDTDPEVRARHPFQETEEFALLRDALAMIQVKDAFVCGFTDDDDAKALTDAAKAPIGAASLGE